MGQELTGSAEYRDTMDRLEKAKRHTNEGGDYWLARDIHSLLGYPVWDKFEPVITRARGAFSSGGIEPSHHIARTSKMMEIGRGARREGADYFLSRPACYLIAMNGDPAKPEIAAAQAYFTVQTRRMELKDRQSEDEKRLALRQKVSLSAKRVSGVAKDAGVRGRMQPIFHDARYQGLYGMSAKGVKRRKGLGDDDNFLDFAGPLELSAHEFQMNLAADVITRERIKGEQRVIAKNREVGEHVRGTIKSAGGTLPENLSLDEPIAKVRERVRHQKKLPKPSGSST
jgi:DNA-damage-inducible protein D